jgi:transposase
MTYSLRTINQNTLNPKKLVNFSESRNPLCENGNNESSLMISTLTTPQTTAIGDTTLIHMEKSNKFNKIELKKMILVRGKKRKPSAIAELAVDTQKMTLKDKSNLCKVNILKQKLLKTSEAESTTKNEGFSSLSMKKLQEISNKLWLPTETDCVGSDLNSSNTYSKNTISNSWFSINQITKHQNRNSLKTCYPSYTFFLPKQTEEENTKSVKQTKKKKEIKKDLSKKACKFIITIKHDHITYGRECGNLIKGIDNTYCDEHIGKLPKDYDQFTTNICEHIITQKSRGLDRKGMICGQFTFGSYNPKYCKAHVKRHPISFTDENKSVLRSFKVRYYPTPKQTEKLNKYFGCCRKIYNLCVENKENSSNPNLKNIGLAKSSELSSGNFKDLRDKYVTKLPKTDEYKYMKEVPKEIRTFAIKEYETGLETSNKRYEYLVQRQDYLKQKYTDYRSKDISKPQVQFRKKNGDQSITVNKDAVKIEKGKLYIYKKSFDDKPLEFRKNAYRKDKKLKEVLKGPIYHDIKITKNRLNQYYVCFVVDVKIKSTKLNENNVVACDPGGRTFMTTYNENKIMEIGKDISKDIYKMNEEIDKGKDKNKLYIKLRNRINDLHYKTIKKLIEYDIIYIPKLNIKNIIEKDHLQSKTKRELQTLSHNLFIQRLKNKGELGDKKIIICDERLTTKTCGKCFKETDIGKSKEYECQKCGLKIDRDINAARNILIKQIKNIK